MTNGDHGTMWMTNAVETTAQQIHIRRLVQKNLNTHADALFRLTSLEHTTVPLHEGIPTYFADATSDREQPAFISD